MSEEPNLIDIPFGNQGSRKSVKRKLTWEFAMAAAALLASCSLTYAQQDCESYPFSAPISVEDVNGGVRIIATASVAVSSDDIHSINDARIEATLEAKSQIAQFMEESIKREDLIDEAISETESMQGESKSRARKEVSKILLRISSSSAAVLRGVVPFGECYTKGREFRVSVGIKPETITKAESLSRSMSNH